MSIRSISACSEAESVDSKVIGATDHQFDGLLVKNRKHSPPGTSMGDQRSVLKTFAAF